MKKYLVTGILYFLAGLFCFSEAVQVPDLVTRINNSGNTVPEAAVPQLPPPGRSQLPLEASSVVLPVVPPVTPVIPESSAVSETVVVPPSPSPDVFGYIDFGAGNPFSLQGDLFLERAAGELPGFSAKFGYTAADGYGVKSVGSGFFERKTALDVRVFDDTQKSDWSAAFSFTDSTDGFQGRNSTAVNLIHRSIEWDTLVHSVSFGDSPVSLDADFSGTVFTSCAEAVPLSSADYTGYTLSPHVSLRYTSGAFAAELFGTYDYETASKKGEMLDGSLGLAFHYARWDFLMDAGGSFVGDAQDGILVPFFISLSREKTDSVVQNLFVKGGLSSVKSSPWIVSVEEPFAELNRVSVYAADWNASAGFAIAPVQQLSVTVDATFRRTALGRGPLVLTNLIDPVSARIPLVRMDRDSFETNVGAIWKTDGAELSGSYSGEWLDRLNRQTVHTLEAGCTLYEKGEKRSWEVSVFSVFSLDYQDIPCLNITGTVRPLRKISVSLSLDDGISLFLGNERKRNGLYNERSGELLLSARIDF